VKTLALKPPKPALTAPRKASTVPTCTSCDKPLNGTGECRGCTK
jgi:ribosomal protein L34E